MIVKMAHLTVLCTIRSRKETLDALHDLGAVHLSCEKRKSSSTLGLDEAEKAFSNAEKAVEIVSKLPSKDVSAKPSPDGVTPEHVLGLVAEIASLEEKKTSQKDEISLYEHFGDFNPEDANTLSNSGLKTRLFKAAEASVPVAKGNGIVKSLDFYRDTVFGVAIGDIELGEAEEIPFPPIALSEMKRNLESTDNALSNARSRLNACRASLPLLKAELADRKSIRDFQAADASMDESDGIAWLTGFCPVESLAKIREAGAKHGWGISSRDPLPDELPPTLLRPPRIFRPITTLFEMIGVTPGYYEADVSVVFYAFFTIFFAMLIGDAGYGAVILALTLAMRARFKNAASAPFILLGVFSIATIVWGILSATYFGIPQDALPACLKIKTATWLGEQSNVMQLCFLLGAIHLSIARLWTAWTIRHDTKALAEVGWTGVIWTMYCVSCLVIIDGFVFPKFMWGVTGISILLIYLFMLKKSELKSEGVNLALLPINIMSCLGDVISYVRLFAVGLASVKVAENFNTMAADLQLPLAAKIPAMILILALGHGLNFAMGALSILVHAVRLNTLEFSNHKGVSWSGFAYEPFGKTHRG